MSFYTDEDNRYAVGTTITAKESPAERLLITKYFRRIYYCSIIGGESGAKQKVYFDRELVDPRA